MTTTHETIAQAVEVIQGPTYWAQAAWLRDGTHDLYTPMFSLEQVLMVMRIDREQRAKA